MFEATNFKIIKFLISFLYRLMQLALFMQCNDCKYNKFLLTSFVCIPCTPLYYHHYNHHNFKHFFYLSMPPHYAYCAVLENLNFRLLICKRSENYCCCLLFTHHKMLHKVGVCRCAHFQVKLQIMKKKRK